MVTAADVHDDNEFTDLHADVLDELKKYGAVNSLLIPRRGRFVGLIFVEFAAVASAVAAAAPLAAKTFAGKKVLVDYETNQGLTEARASDK
jgi:RNA recognition motif-containing protein